MTARTPTYLKARFEQGDIPQGTDYEDLIDSFVNVAVSAEQSIDSNLRTTKQLIADSVSANSIRTSALTVNNLSFSGTFSAASIRTAIVSADFVYADNVIASGMRTTLVSANSIYANTAALQTVSADSINVSGKVIFGSFDISALATTQAGAITLNGTTNFVIFADGNNLAVKLPTSERGREQKIINAASTTLKIFPATSGRFLVTAVNASLNLPADKTALVFHKGDDRYGIVIGGF